MNHREGVELSRGKTAFVIGTGPSLRDIDVSLLKDHTTITFNRAYIAFEDWGFDPTYYLAIDSNDIRSIYKDINNLILNSNIEKFFFTDTLNNEYYTHKDSYQDGDIVSSDEMLVGSEKVYYLWPDLQALNDPEAYAAFLRIRYNNLYPNKELIPHDKAYFPVFVNDHWSSSTGGANAGFCGIKVLAALGYSRIAFVGCDCRYQDDKQSNIDITTRTGAVGEEYTSHADTDINHFSPKYFGKGIHFGKPNEPDILNIWRLGAEILKRTGIQVISCTKNSKANEWYDYIPFEDFIKTI
tara:strand:- start:5550 stop:6440 length:891 start_codon:yes stop_codon:yes gene_type:complete